MKSLTKALIVTGIVAQLAAFTAFAEEKAGDRKAKCCASVSSKSDAKKDQTITSSDHATKNGSNAAAAK